MDRHSAKTGCVEHTEFSIVSSMAGSGSGLGGTCATRGHTPMLSMQVLGAPTASTSTEGGFAQELLRPSEGGCWTYCQGLMARVGLGRTPPPQRAAWQTSHPGADYKRFNRSNVSIRHWSWNYRSCWHQTCPPVGTHRDVWIASIPSSTSNRYWQNCC